MQEQKVTFLLDYREKDLARLLGDDVQSINLELGDAQISIGDELFVFERKTVADLVASIKDGRYREQKARVLSKVPSRRLTYIIEGLIPDNAHNPAEGAIISMLFRDGINVIMSRSIGDTARWLQAFYTRVVKNPEKYTQEQQTTNEWVENTKIKSCKRENIDGRTCLLLQLAQVPGVSAKIADELAKEFDATSISSFIDGVRSKGGNKERMKALQGVSMVGKKKAHDILEFMGLLEL